MKALTPQAGCWVIPRYGTIRSFLEGLGLSRKDEPYQVEEVFSGKELPGYPGGYLMKADGLLWSWKIYKSIFPFDGEKYILLRSAQDNLVCESMVTLILFPANMFVRTTLFFHRNPLR